MNIVRPRLMDCRWLDLCSGSGVMACETIERGARAVTAVEKIHAAPALQTQSGGCRQSTFGSNRGDSVKRDFCFG